MCFESLISHPMFSVVMWPWFLIKPHVCSQKINWIQGEYMLLFFSFSKYQDNFLQFCFLLFRYAVDFCIPNSNFRQFLPKRPKTLFYSRHALTQFQSASSLLHMMRAFNLIKLFFLLCSHTKTFMRKVIGRTWSIQFSC